MSKDLLNIPVLRHNLIRALGDSHLHLPQSYCVLDLETTGLDPLEGCHIWQVGLYPVKDGVPLAPEGENIYLKWPVADLKLATFEIGRRRALANMSTPGSTIDTQVKDGAYYKCEQAFIDEIYDHGFEPKEGLQAVMDTIHSYSDNGIVLTMHNGGKFDMPFLSYECTYFGIPVRWPRNKLIDTGMLIKAAQLNMRILDGEDCRGFYTRVSELKRRGIFYALEKYCIPRWNMLQKYNLDVSKMHGAGFDCVLTSLVLHELVGEVLNTEVVANGV